LVVAPASTLHNWQQEITRFVPNLKALPYWGNVKDRTNLRKFWSKKEISYDQDAPFHVLITSYQLVWLWLRLFSLPLTHSPSPGHPGSTILPTGKVAVYDSRRSTEHQEFVQCSMEDPPRIPMSKSPFADWYPDSEQHARFVFPLFF
jgi:hypothetical protein